MKQLFFGLLVLASGWANAQNITGYEYWFDLADEDRLYIPFDAPAQALASIEDLPLGTLPVGQHKVHYRLKDSNGRWSSVLSKPFTVNPGGPHLLVQFRYWTDQAAQDPVDMHYVPIDPQVQYLDLNTAIAFCASTVQGTHPLYFQIQDNHGFWSSVIQPSDNPTVDIDQASTGPAEPAIDQSPVEAVQPNTVYTFTATSSTAVTYDWELPLGWSIISQSGNSIVAESPALAASGSVFCTVTDVCDGTAQGSVLLANVGVGSLVMNSGLSLAPNPTNGAFILKANGVQVDRIQVLNITGQAVLDLKLAPSDRYTLDLSNEASGLYTVRVMQGNETTQLRVMVQH